MYTTRKQKEVMDQDKRELENLIIKKHELYKSNKTSKEPKG